MFRLVSSTISRDIQMAYLSHKYFSIPWAPKFLKQQYANICKKNTGKNRRSWWRLKHPIFESKKDYYNNQDSISKSNKNEKRQLCQAIGHLDSLIRATGIIYHFFPLINLLNLRLRHLFSIMNFIKTHWCLKRLLKIHTQCATTFNYIRRTLEKIPW